MIAYRRQIIIFPLLVIGILLFAGSTPAYNLPSGRLSLNQGNTASPANYRIIGYYPNWAIYRNPAFYPESIAADKLTHINYAFANHDTDGNIILFDPWADTGYRDDWQTTKPYWGNFRQLYDLKQDHPHLKVLISIGGWTLSDNFSPMAADPEARTNFTRSCIEFCEEYDCFDGVDLDWEYPGFEDNNGHPEDTENFTLLLEEMYTAFKSHDPPLLLTIAAPAGPGNYENIEVSEIHQYLDWINLMTYDLHGPWGGDSVTNHLAPLYPTDQGDDRLNVDSTMDYYRSQGVPENKLVMGIPFYGRSFAGAGSTPDGLYSTYSGTGSQTTEETGYVFFNDIKENRLSTHTRYWDDDCKVPYLHNEDPESPLYLDFISYDDEESIGIKCDYIQDNALGGAMVWELGEDTWESGNWDALSVIDTKLNQSSSPTPPAASPTAPLPVKTATPGPNPTAFKTPEPEPTPTAGKTPLSPTPPIPTPTAPPVPTVTPEPTSVNPTPTPGTSGGFPDRVFAPYVDTCIYPRFFITEQNQAMGTKYYTLAFVVSDSAGTGIPTWGGYLEYITEGDWYRDEINTIRERGGDVIVSFGGASGIELALALEDADSLRAAYQSVIDTYDLSWVDFDIEGAAVADQPSIDRRNRVIKQLQDDNPDLKVAFCLPVLPSGLTGDGFNLLQNAIENGVRIDLVNIMAMDYGDWAAPDPEGWMGEYAIEAAENLFVQLRTLYPERTDQQLWMMVGITPMIGRNDILTEIFDLEDAEQLLDFAQTNNIGLISMWSANRDNGTCGEIAYSSPLCSSLEQDDYAFSTIFNQFTGETGPPTPTPIAASTPEETVTPPATPTPTPAALPSGTPAPEPTSTAAATFSPTPVPEPTSTAAAASSPTPAPTASPAPTPKPTATGPAIPTPSPEENPLSLPVIADGDYDGDGISEIALFRPSAGLWAIRGITRCYFGISEDIPVSGDYNGDGTAQIAVFRSASGLWAVKDQGRTYFGGENDTPAPADYDGDGDDDIGLYRSATGLWAAKGITRTYFGTPDDIPVAGDYNGDGTADIGIFRTGAGLWAIRNWERIYFGGGDDLPVPADYDGDGRIDPAIFRPSTGLWAVRDLNRSYFGGQDDIPIPADYDGNGNDDIALFRERVGLWAISEISRVYFGGINDIPVIR